MYISGVDGDAVTYDIRIKKPNGGDYLSNGAITHLNIFLQHTSVTRIMPTALFT